MSRPISITSAVTFYPSNFISGSYSAITNTSSPVGKSSANTSSYSQIGLTTGSNAETYAIWGFDCSSIPSNATINSVTCYAKVSINQTNTNRITTRQVRLYAGSTAKGTAATVANSTATTTIKGGSWTRSELNEARIRLYAVRSTGNTTSSYYFRFYGADLVVNYSVNTTAYTITASSTYTGASVSPASQELINGDNGVVKIYTDDINSIVVEDNAIDVTENLQYVVPQGGNFSFTGVPSSFDETNSQYNKSAGSNGVYDTNYIENGLTPYTSTTRCALYAIQGSSAVSKMYYNFDCSSIPQNATITSVSCQFKGGTQGTSYYSQYIAQLCSGTNEKGSSQSITGSNSSPSTVTIDGGSSWTRDELNNIKILFQVTRGTSNTTTDSTFSFFGATLTVNYTVPSEPYYEYTITNINDDHNIVVSETIYIPPEEDPEKTYYSLTISSINATTDPVRGTTRVESGDGQTITITPSDPQMTLILDNGVDVSSQLVQHGGAITSSITTVQGASYGFTYSSSTGYYVSQNKGISKSAAVCKVNFNLPVRCLVTIQFINYAEQGYDFGVFGNIDATLSNNYYAAGSGGATITDSNYKLACNTSSYNSSSPQTLTYEIPSGEHFIYIKYSKDDASDDNNDTLQFKILNIEPLEANNYYTYTLSNINQDHSLIFIFGDVTYYFVTSSVNGDGKINPQGQMVELPGDSYKLTIVPNNITDTVLLTDNNIDVTGSLVMKQETIEKDGNQYVIVNYVYTLTNIQSGHTLSVTIHGGNAIYIKQNSNWVQLTKVYKKENGTWRTIDDIESLFVDGEIYIKN